MDLYIELIKDYDRKTRELITESNDLKSFILNIFMGLENTANEFISNNKLQNNENEANMSSESSENSRNSDSDVEEMIKLPFDSIYKKLNAKFVDKFKLISLNSKSNYSTSLGNEENCHLTEENLTISTINNLSETKSSVCMNNTYILERSNLGNTIRESKHSSITSSSQSSFASNDDGSLKKENFIGSIDEELSAIFSEKAKLSAEKKLFYEQKVKFEQEMKMHRLMSNSLEKTVNNRFLLK